MPRFSANLSMLFGESSFEARFAQAAKAGFKAVEYLSPYMLEKHVIADLLKTNDLVQNLFNLSAGNWDGGERGIACLPDRVGEFQDGIGKAIDYAKALGCVQVNCLAGKAPAGLDPAKLRQVFVDNLKFAAAKLAEAKIELVIEPINAHDIPGFFLNRSAQAIAIMDDVGSANLRLQYDIYHMQRMEGELANTIQRLLPRIGHIQIADNPGRNEPGTGEINHAFLFGFLDSIGYKGWVGCEYKPRTTTLAGLGWLKTIGGQG